MKSYLMGACANTKICFAFVFIFCLTCLVTNSDAVACDSCGRECTSACGTKYFRTCCFNYLRKRSAPPIEVNNLSEIPFDSEDSGFIISQKLFNDMIRTEHDLDSIFRQIFDGKRMNLNKKRQQQQQQRQEQQPQHLWNIDNTMDYP